MSHAGKSMCFSKQTIENIRNNTIQRFSKPVLLYDKNNNFIKEYPSASEAERALNAKGHHIDCVCKGKRKTAYGFIWRYK